MVSKRCIPRVRNPRKFNIPRLALPKTLGEARNLTQNTLGRSARPKQCCKPQVTNLDNAFTAIDEDVVTLEVAVNDRWSVTVQIHKTTKDLPCPALQNLTVHMLMLLAVPAPSVLCQPPAAREPGQMPAFCQER